MMNSIEKLISVSGGVSLLYVEDDLTLQQETAQLLRNFFEKIDLAQNGEEGLELFEPGKYEIILTDINMPKLNGGNGESHSAEGSASDDHCDLRP